MRAKPMKRTSLALQTALESPKPSSPLTLSLSIMFMTRYPSSEHIPGTQSTKVTWTGDSSSHLGMACAESTVASRKVQLANANCIKRLESEGSCAEQQRWKAYESSGEIHADGAAVLAKGDVGAGVVADPAGVVVGSGQGHRGGFPVGGGVDGDCGYVGRRSAPWEHVQKQIPTSVRALHRRGVIHLDFGLHLHVDFNGPVIRLIGLVRPQK